MPHDVVQHVPLPFLNRLDCMGGTETARLEISTRLHSRGGIISHARVEFCRAGSSFFVGYSEFYKCVKSSYSAVATQKDMDEQQAREFTPEVVTAITDEVRLHYAKCASVQAICHQLLLNRGLDNNLRPDDRPVIAGVPQH